MKTALDKMQEAIRREEEFPDVYWIDGFIFLHGNCRIEFLGHYFAGVIPNGNLDEAMEYCWDDYDDMLDCVIEETGKTMRQMLAESSELDLDIRY